MECREKEEIKALECKFLEALTEKTPDFDKAKRLLRQGVDINAVDSYGNSVLNNCLEAASFSAECDFCETESCKSCENKRKSQLAPIVDFFIENGWDTVTHGLNCISSLVHTTHDVQMFYATKRILQSPLSEKREDYESALETIGAEESYQRCCEECHEQENLYYAMYEIVDAKMNNKPFDGIFPYHNALGKRIDRIVYFAGENDFKQTPRGIEFNNDLGFVCGGDMLVVRSSINILLMNNRIIEEPQIDVSGSFEEGIVGATVVDVSFEHQKITVGKADYGQPTIVIKLDSGKEIRFTHNFGELPNGKIQSRFLTTEAVNRIIDRRSNLFELCADTVIDLDKIEAYIAGSQMTSEDITRTAIKLADEFAYEVDAFKASNGRAPNAEELITSNWLDLFRVFLKYGLDPNAVYYDDGTDHLNLLLYLSWLDNTYVIYKLFRLLLQNGADPNVIVGDESFFEKIDGDIVLLATLFEIEEEDRAAYEKEFRLWLLLMAYGGRVDNLEQAVQMNEGYYVDMFENCESFSYRREIKEKDWSLHIYVTETGEDVAVL